MNESHVDAGGAQPVPFAVLMPLAGGDDYALGCECANPALQIERWHEEHAGGEPLQG